MVLFSSGRVSHAWKKRLVKTEVGILTALIPVIKAAFSAAGSSNNRTLEFSRLKKNFFSLIFFYFASFPFFLYFDFDFIVIVILYIFGHGKIFSASNLFRIFGGRK